MFDRRVVLSIAWASVLHALAGTVTAQERSAWQETEDGRFVVRDAAPSRPWSGALERGFQERAWHVVRSASRADGRFGNTWFENEKRSYGVAMLSWLAGHDEAARKFLEAPDAGPAEWSAHTAGIDLFPAFTLKHQVRKWFYFGRWLSEPYREQMRQGFELWTERDPLRRPHPAFRGATGWTPEARNSWVDIRGTDNLQLMRDVAIYLFAAEAGRDEVRDLYAGKLRGVVRAIYRHGMGEWDSENYLGHSLAPLLSLHDFAPDPAMRDLARAALDWMTVTASLKYRNGVFGGPDRRDYDHGYAFGGSAASMLWLWFGGEVHLPEHFESDEVHAITSSYRPPEVAVRLARREVGTGRTQRAARAGQAPWGERADVEPEFFETLYIGRHYRLGTLARGTQAPDINGFTLMVDHPVRGADVLLAAPTRDATAIASPRYREGQLHPRVRVLQHEGVALHWSPQGDWPQSFALPADVPREAVGDALFLRWPNSFAVLVPCNTRRIAVDAERSRERNVVSKRVRGELVERPRRPGAPENVVLTAERAGDGAYGFALWAGDVEVFGGDEGKLRAAIRAFVASVECSPAEMRVACKTPGGVPLVIRLGANPAADRCRIDGQLFDSVVPRAFDGEILQQESGGGRLSVVLDGETVWATEVREDGSVVGSSGRSGG